MTQPTLSVIVGSTRPGRVGLPVATWFHEVATAHGAFAVQLVDLAEVGLPFLDEPKHPRLGEYVHQHTRDWSATVERSDAFVFVMPEYNHGYSPSLKNAIDFLFTEWQYKPVGFVSYGGAAGGTRGVQSLKPVVASLKMFPLFEAVVIPMVQQLIDEDGVVIPTEAMGTTATVMLDELLAMSERLRSAEGRRP